MVTLFKPPTPVPIAGGGSGGGTSIINNTSSVSVNVDSVTGDSFVQITTDSKPAITVDNDQYVIIGNKTGIVPTKRLTIVDPHGQGIQIINSLASAATSLVTNSEGGLSINTSGSHIQFGANSLYVGLENLYIGNSAVISTADQLNYTATTPGHSQENKALVVDGFRNIGNINSLVAALLTGTIKTAHQPFIESLNSVDIHSLSLRGTAVQSSAAELNYLKGVSEGVVLPSKAIIADVNKNIGGLNTISASNLSGTITTPNQPNITSIGALDNLVVNQTIGLGTNSPAKAFEISTDSPCIRLNNKFVKADIEIDMYGNLKLIPDNHISIKTHKHLLFSGNSEITGLFNLTATTVSALITTAAQPNITSIGTLESLNVNGDVNIGTFDAANSYRLTIKESEGYGLRILKTASLGCDFNITSTGDLELVPTRDIKIPTGKAIKMNGPIIGVTNLTASTLTGTITTGSQPNITEIGTLSSLTVSNAIEAGSIATSTISGTLLTASQPNITAIGTLSSLAVTNTINTGSVIANSLTGTLLTSSQPNITSVGTLIGLNVSNGITAGSIASDTISGTLLTAAQPNITKIGTLSNLNVSQTINTVSLIAETLSGTLQTASQPNITTIGTLSNLNVLHAITCSTISSIEITGKLLSPDQSNITSVGTLNSLDVRDNITASAITVNTISGTLQTSAQPNITSIGSLNRLLLNGPIGIGVTSPSSIIDINTSNIATDSVIKLTNGDVNVSFGISSGGLVIDTSSSYLTLGSGVNLRFVDGGIFGLSSLTAATLSGTLQTAAQPNITSVGQLDYLDTTYIGLGVEHNDIYRLSILDTNGKFGVFSTGSQSLVLSVVNGDFALNSSNDRVALGPNVSLVLNGGTIIGLDQLTANNISGTIITPNQPNITSIGSLSNLTVNGPIVGKNVSADNIAVSGNLSIGGTLQLNNPMTFNNLFSASATFDSNLSAVSSTNGGTLTVIGGAAFSKNIIVGESLTIGNITLTENSFSGLASGTPGIVEANKTLIPDSNKDLTGFRNLTATNYVGTITTAYQPNITTIGNLTGLNVCGYLGVGTTSPLKQLEINSTTGDCLRLSFDKRNTSTAFVDFAVNSVGSAAINVSGSTLTTNARFITNRITLGNSTNSEMPLEIGWTPFIMTEKYAFRTSVGTTGVFDPPRNGYISYNYSIRALGRILCTQSVDIMSDKRTKKNIKELTDEYCTSFIERTTPVSFNWIDGDQGKSFGYIAQDLIRMGFDDLVNLAHDPNVHEVIDDDGFINPEGVKFTISYQHIIPILAKNQKRLMQENQELKAKLDAILQLLSKIEQ